MKRIFIVSLATFAALFSVTEGMARTYTTSFPATENPISESGNWINGKTNGRNWQDVRTTGGNAIGTQTTGVYDDSTALVTGSWENDQTASATVYITSQGSAIAEVEIRLRSNISTGSCTGYEFLFSVSNSNPYVQIVRWNGPYDNWTLLDATSISALSNGDVVKATAIGTTLTLYINNVRKLQVTDSTYSSGLPGIGFYSHNGGANVLTYGFSDFTVTDGVISPPKTPKSPTNLHVLP